MTDAHAPGGAPLDASVFDLERYAADLRRRTLDAQQQAGQLAETLERLLPGQTRREMRGGWPFGAPRLALLRVLFGTTVYQVRPEGRQVEYQQIHHVGGIDLSHTTVSQDAWLRGLVSALQEQTGWQLPGPAVRRAATLDPDAPSSGRLAPSSALLEPWSDALRALKAVYAQGNDAPGERTLAFAAALTQAHAVLNLPTLTPAEAVSPDLRAVLDRAQNAARQEFEAHTARKRADLTQQTVDAAEQVDRTGF